MNNEYILNRCLYDGDRLSLAQQIQSLTLFLSEDSLSKFRNDIKCGKIKNIVGIYYLTKVGYNQITKQDEPFCVTVIHFTDLYDINVYYVYARGMFLYKVREYDILNIKLSMKYSLFVDDLLNKKDIHLEDGYYDD